MAVLTCIFIISCCVDSCFCIINGCVHCFNLGNMQKVFTAKCGLKFCVLFTSRYNFIPSILHTLFHLHHGRVKGPLPLLWTDSRASRGQVTLCGIPTGLDCVICIVWTQFANVTAGSIIKRYGALRLRVT